MYGLDSRGRLAGFYPSDGEDDPLHSVTLPLTGGASDGLEDENECDSLGGLPGGTPHRAGNTHRAGGRLHASDSDMTHSSCSPSTRSTQSTGVLHTFHPHGPPPTAGAVYARLGGSASSSPARSLPSSDPGPPGSCAVSGPPTVAVVHAMPHTSSQTHSTGLHNPRPPDTGGGQAPLGMV